MSWMSNAVYLAGILAPVVQAFVTEIGKRKNPTKTEVKKDGFEEMSSKKEMNISDNKQGNLNKKQSNDRDETPPVVNYYICECFKGNVLLDHEKVDSIQIVPCKKRHDEYKKGFRIEKQGLSICDFEEQFYRKNAVWTNEMFSHDIEESSNPEDFDSDSETESSESSTDYIKGNKQTTRHERYLDSTKYCGFMQHPSLTAKNSQHKNCFKNKRYNTCNTEHNTRYCSNGNYKVNHKLHYNPHKKPFDTCNKSYNKTWIKSRSYNGKRQTKNCFIRKVRADDERVPRKERESINTQMGNCSLERKIKVTCNKKYCGQSDGSRDLSKSVESLEDGFNEMYIDKQYNERQIYLFNSKKKYPHNDRQH